VAQVAIVMTQNTKTQKKEKINQENKPRPVPTVIENNEK